MKNKSFFDAVRMLLPKTRTFDIVQPDNMRRFFEALTVLPEDVRREIEGVYLDYYPDTTRALEEWENTFRMHFLSTLFSVEERRRGLKVLWRLRYGNTSSQFMQNTLELLFPGVQVTKNVPPVNALGLVFAYKSVNGAGYMRCGNKRAVCDYHVGQREWIPTILRNDTSQTWDLPVTIAKSALCFFISRDVYRDPATREIVVLQRLKIHEKWKRFLEFIVLALKPVHTTAILFVKYIPNDEEIIYI